MSAEEQKSVAGRMRACDAAMLVLRETDNPAVMWGDSGLLHAIAARAGLRTANRSWKTERHVLDTLSRTPGELVPRLTLGQRGRRVRIFYLPEEWARREAERGQRER